MIRSVLLAVALGAAVPASAQEAREPSPRYPAVYITQWGHDGQPDETRLRRAEAGDDIQNWLTIDDPEIQTMLNFGGEQSSASLRLEITSAGRVSDCRVVSSLGDARWASGLCDRISSRVRMRPAIDINGRPMTDAVRVMIEFMATPRPRDSLVQAGPGVPPVIVPGERAAWPPSPGPRASVSGLDLLRGGPDAPEASAEPWSGVVVRPTKDGGFACTVEASSGDDDFNRRACAAAQAGGYNFLGLHSSRRQIGLLYVLQDDTPRVLLPLDTASWGSVQSETLDEVRERLIAAGHDDFRSLRMYAASGPDGRVRRCTISRSSGSDALDVLACRLVREHVRIAVARDVFGRPRGSGDAIVLAPQDGPPAFRP